MAKQIINVGSSANDRKGDSLRAAFQKVNANFSELYDRAENTDSQTLSLIGNTLSISGGNSVNLSDIGFSGSYNDLTETPIIPEDISDLTDIQGLLGQGGSGDTGDITFAATTVSAPNESTITIESKNFDGVANAKLTLDPNNAIAKLESIGSDSRSFFGGDGFWTTATWTVSQYGRAQLVFTGAEQLYAFLDSTTTAWNNGSNRRFSWNGREPISYSGYSYGGGTLTFDLDTLLPEVDPTEITEFRLDWDNVSLVSVDGNDFSELQISGRGIPVEINSTSDVNIEAGNDLRLTGNDILSIRNNSASQPITIRTDYNGDNTKSWAFNADGSLTFPNSGSLRVGLVPVTSLGAVADKQGTVAFDSIYVYYCTADYDGLTNIWKRVAWSDDTW